MTSKDTTQTGREAMSRADDRTRETSRSIPSTVAEFARGGTLATIAGAALLLDAVRTARRDRARAGFDAVAGAALLAFGRRQRRMDPDSSSNVPHGEVETAGSKDESAGSAIEFVGTDDASSEGDVRFTTDREESTAATAPLEGTDADDPRRSDSSPRADEESVTVDLSEAATADETGEATGPDPTQAYPASEGTDPEPMAEEAPPRGDSGNVAGGTDSDEESSTKTEN
ncbi:hypothetical protein [Natronolimnohabitans innermongolicus]|nr:hypothetical protein [Natronolimnohabitans innermongolicus]